MITNKKGVVAENDSCYPVCIQDQTSPVLIITMLQPLASATLAADTVYNGYTIEVDSATGMAIGQSVRIIDIVNNRFFQGSIIDLVGTTITTDMPMDFVYTAGVEVATGNLNMAVDGSVTPVVFSLRIGSTSIPATADVTRMIMVCEANTAVDLNKFGDLPELERGVVFRSTNGTTQNIWLTKSNRGLVGIGYDWTPYAASNPSQGIDGFGWRLTFNGQEKLGVALRVQQDENLEIIIQDDLTGLVSLSVVLEGHAVEE